jgi:hypothetical protein
MSCVFAFVVVQWQSQVFLWYVPMWHKVRWRLLDYQNGSTCLIKKDSAKGAESIYLRDVPMEVRKKEAKKPLFLIRYE